MYPLDALSMIELKRQDLERKLTKKGSFVVLEGYFTRYIKSQLSRGVNFVIVMTGRTRSGKSFSSLRMCEKIDPNFTIDNVVFSAREFMDLLKSGKLKEGSIILWDEVGTGKSMSSREWYSILNKSINYVLQTWGYKSIGLIMTVPDFSFIDSQTRKLCNAHIQTMKLARKRGIVKAKVHFLSPMKDDVKRVKPRYTIDDNKMVTEYMEIKKPSTKLVNLYDKKKRAFTEELNADIIAELETLDKKGKEHQMKLVSDEDLLEEGWEKLKGKITMTDTGKRNISIYLIRKVLKVTVERAKFVKEKLLQRSEIENYPEYSTISDLQPKKIDFRKSLSL